MRQELLSQYMLNRRQVRKIKFDEFDLLELFESEPIIVHGDEQAGVFMYSKNDTKGVNIVFTFDVYQCCCEFSLNLDGGKYTICEYKLNNVASLKKVDKSLRIISKDDDEIVRINFNPSTAIGIVEI